MTDGKWPIDAICPFIDNPIFMKIKLIAKKLIWIIYIRIPFLEFILRFLFGQNEIVIVFNSCDVLIYNSINMVAGIGFHYGCKL